MKKLHNSQKNIAITMLKHGRPVEEIAIRLDCEIDDIYSAIREQDSNPETGNPVSPADRIQLDNALESLYTGLCFEYQNMGSRLHQMSELFMGRIQPIQLGEFIRNVLDKRPPGVPLSDFLAEQLCASHDIIPKCAILIKLSLDDANPTTEPRAGNGSDLGG